MACGDITSGISLGCRDNAGGIKVAYLTSFTNVTAIGFTNSSVNSITMATASKFYQFTSNKNTGAYNQVPQVSVENGSVFYQGTLNLMFTKMETAKRNIVATLATATLIGIVKDFNDKYWLIGSENGIYMTSDGAIQTGTLRGDMNGYNLNFLTEEKNQAYEVDSTIIAALLSPTVV